jgi:hypothetical protein
VNKTWQFYNRGVVNARNENCRSEWWILWRRIAAGLSSSQQQTLAAPLIASLRALLQGRKSSLKHAPHELSEAWRLLGALEKLEVPLKLELGGAALRVVTARGTQAVQGAPLWALARIGSRVPSEAPLSSVVPPEFVEPWLRALLRLATAEDSVAFAIMQLARRTGDRYRDIPQPLRQVVSSWFDSNLPASPYRRLVEREETLRREEQGMVFGESLPKGLTLATERAR